MSATLSRLSRCTTAIVVLLLTACFSTKYEIDKPDYADPQKAASVVVSDPQVFGRASLINDRKKEIAYLGQLLDNSKIDGMGKSVVNFTPQILQDLHTIQALSANFGLSLASVQGNPTAVDLTKQIEVAKLQANLAVLQKQTEGIQAATPPATTIPAADTSAAAASAMTVTPPDVSALQTAIGKMQTQLTALTAAANQPGAAGAPTGSTAYSTLIDPRSDFIDRQAFRRDIRAAIAEADLDDVHDRAGNALYRFQFQATVLPPTAATKQWAAARLQLLPPELSVTDVNNIYFGWLRHIGRDMTQLARKAQLAPNESGADKGELVQYLGSTDWSPYLALIDVYYSPQDLHFGCVERRISSAGDPPPLKAQDDYQYSATYAVPPKFAVREGKSLCGAYDPGADPKPEKLSDKDIKTLYDWLGAPPPVQRGSKVAAAPDLLAFEQFARRLPSVMYFNQTESSEPSESARQRTVPERFCKVIVAIDENDWCNGFQQKSSDDHTRKHAEGGTPNGRRSYSVRSYSILPLELAQRAGISSESSQSLQTAISVAAKLSQAATAGLDAGSQSQSDIRTQAILRQPLVIGFAGSNNVTGSDTGSFFGWLFGPEFNPPETSTTPPPRLVRWLYSPATVSERPKGLVLAQPVRTYGVTADVSFPGWWDSVQVQVRTAWVGNWNNSGNTLDVINVPNSVTTTRTVRVPVNDAVFADLTSFIGGENYAVQNQVPSIDSVTPDVLPTACAGKVVLAIRGNNVWRADNVYLAGVAAELVEVWPNMTGISARFDLGSVFGGTLNGDSAVQTIPLVVATRQGDLPPFRIIVVGKRQLVNGVATCESPLLLPGTKATLEPTVALVTPKDEVCTTDIHLGFVIDGVNLPESYTVNSKLFNPTPRVSGNELHRAIELAPNGGIKSLPEGKLKLVIVGGKTNVPPEGSGVLALPVSLNVVKCAAKAAAKQSTPAH
jgi:hypothetical protein